MNRTLVAAGLFMAAVSGPGRAATVFSDGTFAPIDYATVADYSADPAASVVASQCLACGNPGAAIQFTFNEPTGSGPSGLSLFIAVVNTGFLYDPTTQGAIASIGASADKNFQVDVMAGFNNRFRPIVFQNGNVYSAAIDGMPFTGPATTGFEAFGNPALFASDFLRFDPATGGFTADHPDFAGAPIEFGVGQALGGTAVAPTNAVVTFDNLVIAVTSVPEPASAALLFAGVGMLGLFRRRRS